MTLQNDPPSLESVSEYEDQYKNYGKSIRKLIIDCLQKDPTKRPTASELLKHPFIKKAKDRRYLMHTLLPSTPSFADRSRRALDGKRGSGFDSANNGESGSWVWPQEDANQRPQVMFTEPVTTVIEEGSQSSGSASSITDGVGSSTKSNDTYEENRNIVDHDAIHIEQKPILDQHSSKPCDERKSSLDQHSSKPCDESKDKQFEQVNDCTNLLK